MALDVLPQGLVDARLVLGALGLEPGEHIFIESDRNLLFDGAVELPNLGTRRGVLKLGDVREIDIRVRKLV